ncbi:CLUMA_CG010114, isoform A [Clunio marinus]|uniref:CLUMA_CG010114, isoform A n=1 Tax=Clunio marinus TaxID=568069 RepID=A0A1J1I8Y5_9DIPT|nr:CLUMA_CG010114, isoform A [Clunio marinus]
MTSRFDVVECLLIASNNIDSTKSLGAAAKLQTLKLLESSGGLMGLVDSCYDENTQTIIKTQHEDEEEAKCSSDSQVSFRDCIFLTSAEGKC